MDKVRTSQSSDYQCWQARPMGRLALWEVTALWFKASTLPARESE